EVMAKPRVHRLASGVVERSAGPRPEDLLHGSGSRPAFLLDQRTDTGVSRGSLKPHEHFCASVSVATKDVRSASSSLRLFLGTQAPGASHHGPLPYSALWAARQVEVWTELSLDDHPAKLPVHALSRKHQVIHADRAVRIGGQIGSGDSDIANATAR